MPWSQRSESCNTEGELSASDGHTPHPSTEPRFFTILDVKNRFWHVSLDEESSYMTTFQTPFGRYRWRHMPFGISSAPEVFHRRLHELIEGLTGIEVVADDFIAVSYGYGGSGSGSWQKSSGLPPKTQRKKGPPQSRESKAATVSSTIHWTHGYGSGTANRSRQSSNHCGDATSYRQTRSTMSSGTGPVPCQIPSASLWYNQAVEGPNTEQCTVGVGWTAAGCIWEAKRNGYVHPSPMLL